MVSRVPDPNKVMPKETAAAPRVELLAPAGDWDCARAAVENGADAIYFGLDRFNARMRADNFSLVELPELMRFLHGRGLRGYLAFNTLVFEGELAEAEAFLREAIASGVDAAIVQDVGLCRLIRRISPDFPIHASTQMTITGADGLALARELGASLAVVARECSVAEIAKMREISGAEALPIEAFVHGALCVAYSGQCLTSESLGGRSANRGECAQACRLPYELIADGMSVPLGGRKYLLSPRDLAGVAMVPAMIRAGVSSFKIEGRLKSAEYVASITRVYRRAIDEALANLHDASAADLAAKKLRREKDYELEMAFSRGLHTGWLAGTDNRALVHAVYPKKRGVRLGRVAEVAGSRVRVMPFLTLPGQPEPGPIPVKQGDGVVFDLGQSEAEESGGFVTSVEPSGRGVWLAFHRPSLRWEGVKVGATVWKTSDPALARELRASFADGKVHSARPVDMIVTGSVGTSLCVRVRDEAGREASAESLMPLEEAREHPLTKAILEKQLGRLGGTPFVLRRLDCQVGEGAILPLGEQNRLRRVLVEKLTLLRETGPKWTIREVAVPREAVEAASGTPPLLVPLVRDMAQLEVVLPLAKGDVYAEFEDHKAYRAAMEKVRAWREAHGGKGPSLFAAPPRVHKDSEKWILDIIASAGADGYLVRNAAHLRAFAGKRLRGDYSLNVANSLAAEFYVKEKGLEGVTASCDLDAGQLEELLRHTPPQWLEITLHQHMPMFHMEHCVFCAFLSEGHDYRDCGRPCEKKRVYLKDRVGLAHYLRADAGCRNTLFNARAQSGAEYADRFLALGVRRFRIEFLEETPAQVTLLMDRYDGLLAGRVSPESIWREFKLLSQLGVTRGTLRAG
jgi:putative protease